MEGKKEKIEKVDAADNVVVPYAILSDSCVKINQQFILITQCIQSKNISYTIYEGGDNA